MSTKLPKPTQTILKQNHSKIEELAKAEYDAGGSDAVVSKIENMSSDDLKSHLIKLIKNNMNIGVEIINEGE